MGRTLTTEDLTPIRDLVELLEASNTDVISIDIGTGAPKKISIANLKKTFLPYAGALNDINLGEQSAYMDSLHLSDAPVSTPTDEGALYMSNGELMYVSDSGAVSLKALIDSLDTDKADKDTDAVAGNFAYFDGEGNPVDSGKKDADYEDADITILKQANVVNALDSTSIIAPLSANQGKVLKDAQDVLNGDISTEGSVLKSIKDNAENATYDNTDSGLSATTLKTAIDENAGNVGNLAGAGRSTETVKGNADAIALRELLSNKKTTLADNSDTFYPTQKAVKTVTDNHESRIVVLENWTRVKSWLDVQEVVRAGRAEAYFPVGLQFTADWNSVPRTLDVIGYHDIPTNTDFTHALTLQFHDILRTGRISAPEAMYNAVTELPDGTYIFTTNGVQYTFTSTQAVPAGGVIYIKTRSEYVPLTLTIYASDRKTVIEDDIAVTTTSGTDNLSPINDHVRMRYGNNNYPISAIRQWLNSESATFAWQPLGLYDMPSSYETAGFINLLDADLQAVIGAVDKQVAQATYDGAGQDTFSDKAFLLSRVEVGLGTEGVATGESVYAYYDGVANDDRIKVSGTTPGTWWLRSPYVSGTYSARVVGTSGGLYDGHASTGYGLAPACVII